MTALEKTQVQLDIAIEKYNQAVFDFEAWPTPVMRQRVECAAQRVNILINAEETIRSEFQTA